MMEVSVNHLLLQILSKSFKLSCIRFCNIQETKRHQYESWDEQAAAIKSMRVFPERSARSFGVSSKKNTIHPFISQENIVLIL